MAEGVVGVGYGGGDAAVDAGAFGGQASEGIIVEGAPDIGGRHARTGEDGDLLCKNTRSSTDRVLIVDNCFNSVRTLE